MTNHHDLTRAELASVATGDLDAAVVGKLVVGQLRQRIVMLTVLLDRAMERFPGVTANLDAAFNLLADAQLANPPAVQWLLTDPAIGAWLSGTLRRLHTAGDADDQLSEDLLYLSAIAVAAAARAGHACSIEVSLRDGSLMVPTFGRIELPGVSTATATVQDGQLSLCGGGHGAAVIEAEAGPGWQRLRRLVSQAGALTLAVDLDDLGADPDTGAPSCRLTPADVEAWQSALDGAWSVLVDWRPQRAGALAAGLRRLVPLAPTTNGDAASSTARDTFGSIAATAPRDRLSWADTLVHEFHHSVLYALSDMVNLHHGGDEAVHYSPWRDDPRPVEGLLHGAYSYLGVVDFWRGQRAVLTGAERRLADFEFARWRRQVVQAGRVLLDGELLTEDGVAFVTGMVITGERWLTLPVDERAGRFADLAVADHRIRWRLRHRVPDPGAVASIVTARLAGEGCPVNPAEVAGEVIPHPPGLPLGDRTRLAAIAVRDEADLRMATGTAEDLRLVSGAVGEARAGYLAAVRRAPQNIEAWAGLALCRPERTALRTAPEVVRAVATALGDLDVPALDDWLSGSAPADGRDHLHGPVAD